ncbi:MAG: acyl carrier protein phosphodiesterase, partial [Desulfosarcinaceae bacterium]
ADLVRGLRQHRAVDRLSVDHPAVRRSRGRLDDRFGHTKGILVDIFYDHLLARNWSQWGCGRLADFAADAYALLQEHEDLLAETFRPVVRRMIRHDWLTAYRDAGTIKFVLERMSGRLQRPNLLHQGHLELERCGGEMAADCLVFLQDARAMLADQNPVGE